MIPWCIEQTSFLSFLVIPYRQKILWAVYFPSTHMFPTTSSLPSVLSLNLEAINVADEQMSEAKRKQHKWKQTPYVSGCLLSPGSRSQRQRKVHMQMFAIFFFLWWWPLIFQTHMQDIIQCCLCGKTAHAYMKPSCYILITTVFWLGVRFFF